MDNLRISFCGFITKGICSIKPNLNKKLEEEKLLERKQIKTKKNLTWKDRKGCKHRKWENEGHGRSQWSQLTASELWRLNRLASCLL